jgi:hypothetical protein
VFSGGLSLAGTITGTPTFSGPLLFTGIGLNGLPQGWTATLDSADGGALVDPNTGVPVHFTITMGANAQPGGTGEISAASSGIETVPQSQYQGQTHHALGQVVRDPGMCPGPARQFSRSRPEAHAGR